MLAFDSRLSTIAMSGNAHHFFQCGILFKLQLLCFISALFMDGFGNILFGITLPTNVSTIFIFLALVFQLLSGTFRIPILLLIIYIYIAIQTFLFNYSSLLFYGSLAHFLGVILFSIIAFSFVSAYRDRILYIIRVYYKFCFIIACIAIIQSAAFVIFGETISLQKILGGPPTPEMLPEIYGVIPRSTGTASEPATYAVMLIPGMFLALQVFTGRVMSINLKSKMFAGIILTGFVLSFSMLGFIALGASILIISIRSSKKSRLIAISIASGIIAGGLFVVSDLAISTKLTSLASMSINPADHVYTTSDLTGFAIVSNMLVAKEGLSRSYFFGTGLNTHEKTYDETITLLFNKSQIIYELNKKDAGSLFIRLASELGLPGLLTLVLFLLRYKLIKNVENSTLRIINDMCFITLIFSSVRNGSYMNVVFLLFSAIYLYSYILAKANKSIILNRIQTKAM